MRRKRLQPIGRVFVDGMIKPEHEVKVALVGKYAGLSDSYVSMSEALRHGGAACRTRVCISYLEAEKLEQNLNASKTWRILMVFLFLMGLVHEVRKEKSQLQVMPERTTFHSLGICYGFQLAVIEFARNVCGLKDANSTEINPTHLIQSSTLCLSNAESRSKAQP